jgi:RsiW-degrading membrane proteinase PrsW (M82 family)
MGILIISLAPVFIILCYIYFRDRYEKEPVSLLVKAVVAGMLIVIPILGVERFLIWVMPGLGDTGSAAYQAFLVAGTTEEVFKYMALFLLIWRSPEFNEQFDGIVYAVFISLGFAAVENVIYVLEGGYRTAIIRAITAVPAHALFGVTMGYYFGIARRYQELRRAYLAYALLVPLVLHGLYDFILLVEVDWLLVLFLPYVILLYVTGARKIKRLSDVSVFRPDDGGQEIN